MNSSFTGRPIAFSAFAVCAAASLALAGCSTDAGSNTGSSPSNSSNSAAAENQDTGGSSQSEETGSSESTSNSGSFFSGAATTKQSGPTSPAPAQSNEDVGKQIMDQLASGLAAGDTLTIGNVSTTACVVGDGWGTHVWAAGPNTSCDFTKSVGDALTQPLNATTENVRATLPQTVKVASPATGQAYDMTCTVDAAKVIACRGGNNATVYLY